MLTRILWVLQHPTPYNVYLLNALGPILGCEMEAVYRTERLASHPWHELPARRFRWRVAEPVEGRDKQLDRRCRSDAESLVVFGGWRDATIRSALLQRAWWDLPFAFWTDTPKSGRSIPRRLLNGLFVRMARKAVVTLTTGTPAIERYRGMGIPGARLANFPFVVDPAHFGRAIEIRETRPTGDAVRFVIPARLIQRLKGQAVAIEALARLHGAGKSELVLAGTGPDEAALSAVAQRLGVGTSVRFAGWLEYDHLPVLLGSADALLLPSYWDPFPVAVIEGMAAGLPVLGSDACGSVLERVTHGKNGFIHRAGDAGTLAEQMFQLASDPELRARMGRCASETATRWGIKHSGEVLRRVVARASGSRDAFQSIPVHVV